jgi:hypothetical protein
MIESNHPEAGLFGNQLLLKLILARMDDIGGNVKCLLTQVV